MSVGDKKCELTHKLKLLKCKCGGHRGLIAYSKILSENKIGICRNTNYESDIKTTLGGP
jgi:hypothetical protein